MDLGEVDRGEIAIFYFFLDKNIQGDQRICSFNTYSWQFKHKFVDLSEKHLSLIRKMMINSPADFLDLLTIPTK